MSSPFGHLPPTFFVYLGSEGTITGIEQWRSHVRPHKVEYLAMDTNPDSGKWFGEDFIHITNPDSRDLDSVRKGNYGTKIRSELNPLAMREMLGEEQGAGGRANCGRIALQLNGEYIPRIIEILQRLSSCSANEDNYQSSKSVSAIIVGSGGGSTARGNILSFSETLQLIAQQLNIVVNQHFWVLMPGMIWIPDMDSKRASATGLMIDLAARISGHFWTVDINDAQRIVSEKQLKNTSLSSVFCTSDYNSEFNLSKPDLNRHNADMLRNCFLTPQAVEHISAFMPDTKAFSQGSNGTAWSQYKRFIYSVGQAKIVFPHQLVQSYAEAQIAIQILNHFDSHDISSHEIQTTSWQQLSGVYNLNSSTNMNPGGFAEHLSTLPDSSNGFSRKQLAAKRLPTALTTNSLEDVEKYTDRAASTLGSPSATIQRQSDTLTNDFLQAVDDQIKYDSKVPNGLQVIVLGLQCLLANLEMYLNTLPSQRKNLEARQQQLKTSARSNADQALKRATFFNTKGKQSTFRNYFDDLLKIKMNEVDLLALEAVQTLLKKWCNQLQERLDKVIRARATLKLLKAQYQCEITNTTTTTQMDLPSYCIPVGLDQVPAIVEKYVPLEDPELLKSVIDQFTQSEEFSLEMFVDESKMRRTLEIAMTPLLKPLERLNIETFLKNYSPERIPDLVSRVKRASRPYFPKNRQAIRIDDTQRRLILIGSPSGENLWAAKYLNGAKSFKSNESDAITIVQISYGHRPDDLLFYQNGFDAIAKVTEEAGFNKVFVTPELYLWVSCQRKWPEHIKASVLINIATLLGQVEVEDGRYWLHSYDRTIRIQIRQDMLAQVWEHPHCFNLAVELLSRLYIRFQVYGREAFDEQLLQPPVVSGLESNTDGFNLSSVHRHEVKAAIRDLLDFWSNNSEPNVWKGYTLKTMGEVEMPVPDVDEYPDSEVA